MPPTSSRCRATARAFTDSHCPCRPADAERTYLSAIATLREVGHTRNEGITLGNLGSLYLDTGRFDLAARTYEQALACHRGMNRCRASLVLLARGLAAEARTTWQEGAALVREAGATALQEAALAAMREACRKAGVAPLDA